VMRSPQRRGYGHALNALCAEVSRRSRYARRDGMVVMQADFTDQPELLPELVKRFEGGADIVVGERERSTSMPVPVRRLSRVAPWMIRPNIAPNGVRDPFGSFRLYRLSVIRDLLKAAGDAPLVTTDGWAANVELLVKAMPMARRVERVDVASRYDLRPRDSRVRPFADAVALYKQTQGSRRWTAKAPT
jgi:hypothetical protein